MFSSIVFASLESDRFSIIEFYSRRERRIYPALLFVMSVVLAWLISRFIEKPVRTGRYGKSIVPVLLVSLFVAVAKVTSTMIRMA